MSNQPDAGVVFGSARIAGSDGPLSQVIIMADIILVEMDKAGLRSGAGTFRDPLRPNWDEMTKWCEIALKLSAQDE